MLKKAAVIIPAAILIILVFIGLIALAGSLLKADTPAKTKKPVVKKIVKPVVKKPMLVIDEPPANYLTDQAMVKVQGRTDPDSTLMVDGKKTPVREDGSFSYSFNLVYGMNMSVISATSKSGGITEKEISVDCRRAH
jgi:hypothetical protein